MMQDEIVINSDIDELDDMSISDDFVEHRRLRPLSSTLEFDISNRPSQAKDRVSKTKVYIGVFIGLFLIVLGFMPELFTANNAILSKLDTLPIENKDGMTFASWFFIAIGALIILTRLALLNYGRDFFIGHKFAAVIVLKPFEKGERLADSLDEYLGVRYRSRIVNVFGLTSFTQHIIDLQHPNETKTIPLYVSKNGESISKKWEEFCRQMDMPALFNTTDGIIKISRSDLKKELPLLIKEQKISVTQKNLYKVPKSFKIIENLKTCQVEPLIRDSALSTFTALISFFALFSILFTSILMHTEINYIITTSILSVIFIMIMASLYFRRKRIIVSKKGIHVKSRWIFFPSFEKIIEPNEIEYIYVIPNSYDFKDSLVIGAGKKTVHVGKGLPKEDLLWLQNFLNAQIKRFICDGKIQ